MLKLKRALQALCVFSGFAYLVFWITRPSRRVKILLYHRVNDLKMPDQSITHRLSLTSEQFDKQMAFLARHCRVISLESLVSLIQEGRPLPRNGVVLTFDDGYGDNARVAAPILRKYGFPATVFVTTGLAGGELFFWWDRLEALMLRYRGERLIIREEFLKLDMVVENAGDRIRAFWSLYHQLRPLESDVREKSLENLIRFLDVPLGAEEMKAARTLRWDELKTLADQGFSAGAHTHSHALLSRLPMGRVENEVVLSKTVLEKNLQRPVTLFAYPVGNVRTFNQGVETLLRRHGFQCGVTTIQGTVKGGDNLFRLKRINIDGMDSMSAFRCKIMGVNSLTQRLLGWVKRTRKAGKVQEANEAGSD